MSESVLNPSQGRLFLDWWLEHLLRVMPAARGAEGVGRTRWARVSVTRDRYWEAGAKEEAGRPLSTAPTGGEVALVLDDTNGFRRRVTLPIAVHRAVRQVLSHDLDRLTPLRANDLYFDAHVVSRDWASGTCVAELVAAPRARVRQQLEAVEARGLTVTRVVLAPEDLAAGVDLLSGEEGAAARSGASRRRSRLLTLLLALTCLVLLLALAALPVWQARARVIALQAAEAQARIDAEQASVLQRQVERQLGEYNFLLQRKHATPLVAQLLDDLSKRLPDDTWVQTLEIKTNPQTKAREVVIQGETGSGARIVQIVQESPLIKEPALKAAMTRLAPNAERFHIGGELVLAELPEKLRPTDPSSAVTVPLAPASAAGAPSAASPTAGKAADTKSAAEAKTEPKVEPRPDVKVEARSNDPRPPAGSVPLPPAAAGGRQ